MSLGDNIRKIRKSKKITMKELGEKINLSEQAIGNYERGDREPSLDTIKAIARVLDVPMVDIIGEDTEIGFKAHIEGYSDDVDSYYKSPSDVKTEITWDNINNVFDKFASNEFLQNELNYQYDKLNLEELCALESSVISILDIRLKLLKEYGSDALFNMQQDKLINNMIYQLIETMIKLKRE